MMAKYRSLVVWAIICGLIKWFSLYPSAVERWYAGGAYPVISACQRLVLGWIPVSIGDLLYAVAGLSLLWQLWLIVWKLRRREATGSYFLGVLRRLVLGMLVVYATFNLLWGLNYNRPGIGFQLGISNGSYGDSDLATVTRLLAAKLNDLRPSAMRTRSLLDRKRYLFGGAIDAYARVGGSTPLRYRVPSVKPSLYSYLGNYLGFTGYYNPFTGEAQVNTTVPLFVQPFTTCHEIGHQLGYAKESEANFAGYLSASASRDTSFLYSVYFDMYLYAARYLYYSDSAALRRIHNGLSTGVNSDRAELARFVERYTTPVEAVIDRLYSRYLRANEQPSGRMSYNEVISLLIAYYKKYGHI